MGERKVLNKYYPPDFDPAKIPRRRQPKNMQMNIRFMLPMTVRCKSCGNYIGKGTKVNSRKEDCVGETYLGIQIFRFYFNCTGLCTAELTMKTDPQNSDYTMESGATRNFEPWRAKDEAVESAKSKRDAEELGDAMKTLENRSLDSKQEMDIMAALDEMKSLRARQARVGTAKMLEALKQTRGEKEKDLAEEDEAALRSVVFQNSNSFVRRVDDGEFEDDVDFEAELLQRKMKRRRGESVLGRNTASRKDGSVQVVSSPVEHIPDMRSKGKLTTVKANVVRAPFARALAVRPQPVTFLIKPKGSSASTESKM